MGVQSMGEVSDPSISQRRPLSSLLQTHKVTGSRLKLYYWHISSPPFHGPHLLLLGGAAI